MGMTEASEVKLGSNPGDIPETAHQSKEHISQHHHQEEQDNAEAQTHPLLKRFINLPSSINFELLVQCAWETTAITFQFSLLNGGPASMVYGGILATFGATAVALSLAEMASIDPIVGAQYRWSANFAPFAPRFFGLIQGWVTVFAWIFAAAAPPATLANTTSAMIIFNNPSYEYKTWHTAILMWAYIILPLVFNLYFRKLLNTFETIGGIIHVVLLLVIIVTLTSLARRSTTDFVFKTVIHSSPGWTNPGISFMVGLLTVVFPVAGADGVLHMSAEVKHVNARFEIPLNTLGLISGVCFILSLIYIGSLTAFNAIISLCSIAFHVSYILPILFLSLRKIYGPPVKFGPFKLGRWGLPINAFALIYLVFVIIWMPFPSVLPVTASTMNYSGPILLIVIIGAVADWFISGRKRFEFPIARHLPDT